jgi:hypothetical protein
MLISIKQAKKHRLSIEGAPLSALLHVFQVRVYIYSQLENVPSEFLWDFSHILLANYGKLL